VLPAQPYWRRGMKPSRDGIAEIYRVAFWPGVDGVLPAQERERLDGPPVPRVIVPPAWPLDKLVAGQIVGPDVRGISPAYSVVFNNGTHPRYGQGQHVDGVERGIQSGKFFLKLPGKLTHIASMPVPRQNAIRETGDFALQVRGTVSGAAGLWGMSLSNGPGSLSPYRVNVVLDTKGQLFVESVIGNADNVTVLPAIINPKINVGEKKINTLLAVVRGGRTLELYVNGKAVCQPLVLERELNALAPGLVCYCLDDKGATAEFNSVTGWMADRLTTPEQRGAVKPK
jgi:hypothetical protein